jgi:peptide/nickel transport system ATP-binding protein
MLVAHNLNFRYRIGGPPVLSDLSLTLDRGEIVGLAGDSGTGKSTLARLLAGYLLPQTGIVHIDGQPLPSSGPRPVQMLFQTPELAVNPRWTIGEILTELHSRNDEIWGRFGIRDAWLSRYPHELSGGELHRVAIARSLSPVVQYIVADEISGMLDTITQAEIWKGLLAFAAERRVGILVVSHDAHLLARIAQRTLFMEKRSFGARIAVPPNV